jgi:hypothetical protein
LFLMLFCCNIFVGVCFGCTLLFLIFIKFSSYY